MLWLPVADLPQAPLAGLLKKLEFPLFFRNRTAFRALRTGCLQKKHPSYLLLLKMLRSILRLKKCDCLEIRSAKLCNRRIETRPCQLLDLMKGEPFYSFLEEAAVQKP